MSTSTHDPHTSSCLPPPKTASFGDLSFHVSFGSVKLEIPAFQEASSKPAQAKLARSYSKNKIQTKGLGVRLK
jgi:hypothetical protein